MKRSYKADEYLISVKRMGEYLWAYNLEFEIQHHERLTSFSDQEKLIQTTRLILGIQNKISERLGACMRLDHPLPTPITTEHVLRPKISDLVSVKDAAKFLGEDLHTIRRMADDGTLKSSRTRKGHRRFKHAELERFEVQRRKSNDAGG